jgi:hypothetical protein
MRFAFPSHGEKRVAAPFRGPRISGMRRLVDSEISHSTAQDPIDESTFARLTGVFVAIHRVLMLAAKAGNILKHESLFNF